MDFAKCYNFSSYSVLSHKIGYDIYGTSDNTA